ncbi:hypothetical protein [Pyrococcus sp. ST04]|uniref:hypothetical protein n=1 Tax=Pyrococcus sp. ST04 TaxID=1183377 RepID=UPI000260602C|nr:hypothetical protein [Pyrococcus sp. ST04]AFK22784.1 hypothetical protein Py04_1210 [Pyrococcus sp. ST04]
MRLLRLGPGIFFAKGKLILKKGISMEPEKAFEEAQELDTIIIHDDGAILIKEHPWKVLSELINSNQNITIKPSAPLILMRSPNPRKMLELIKDRVEGRILDPKSAILNSTPDETVILTTKSPLNRPVPFTAIEGGIIVEKEFQDVYRFLILEAPMLISEIEPHWNEITIKLYDSTNHYKENIERLIITIEDLDIGFIVSEGWDWDYPRPLLRVPVYRLKLLTWESPERIKFLLKGLEYSNYKRLCDIDVIVEGRKIGWFEVGKFKSKFEIAKAARKELEELLSDTTLARLREIEEKLAKTI